MKKLRLKPLTKPYMILLVNVLVSRASSKAHTVTMGNKNVTQSLSKVSMVLEVIAGMNANSAPAKNPAVLLPPSFLPSRNANMIVSVTSMVWWKNPVYIMSKSPKRLKP